jgi:hypothetical protein
MHGQALAMDGLGRGTGWTSHGPGPEWYAESDVGYGWVGTGLTYRGHRTLNVRGRARVTASIRA